MSPDLNQIPVFQDKEWARFDLTLTRIKRALQKIGVKQPNQTILVGGTNGKGTVALNLAHHWSDHVGLFSSPHLIDIRERITISGAWLAAELWLEAYHRASLKVRDDELSYFEWVLVLALIMFEIRGVERAVFEVGLGGRWDATNALDPFLSVLTNVELDHQKILGSSRQQIALEKIEIARSGRPFFAPSYLLEWPDVRHRLMALSCELKCVELKSPSCYEDNKLVVDAVLGFLGASTATELLKPLGRRSHILPQLWLDGAHNEVGWSDCARHFQGHKMTMICGLTEGRDPLKFLDTFSDIAEDVFVVGEFDRALELDCWPNQVHPLPANWWEWLGKKPILVCGSLYAVGFILKTLMQKGFLDEKRIIQASFSLENSW